MRVPRIHVNGPLTANQTLPLSEAATRHVVKVLRLKPGAPLEVFDGSGGAYPGTLAREPGHGAAVRLGAHRRDERESRLATTLAQGISRGTRMDYTLQKAVELGVSRIVPLFCRRSQVKLQGRRLEDRLTHWRGVLIAACEQCGRNRLPDLETPRALVEWLPDTGADLRLLLDPEGDRSLDAFPAARQVTLLIGPEGGFDAEELRLARAGGFAEVRLGPRILRTETAAVAALAAVQTLWGDLR